MAKVRVYELAKELDMDSMELVKKVVAGGMDVKNYMSTLDDDAVLRAKEIVSGVVSEVIEEKRIKATVIRRRKKIKIRQEPEKAITEPEKEADETGAPEPEAFAEEEQRERAADVQEAIVEIPDEAKEKKEAGEPAIDKEAVVDAEARAPEEAPEVVAPPEKPVRTSLFARMRSVETPRC